MTASITSKIASFAQTLCYEDLPEQVVEKIKFILVDTLGICIAATEADFGEAGAGLAHRWGGAPEATAIGVTNKVPAHVAALANGILAHGHDFDDTHTESVVHASAAIVPSVLAIAERRGLSGRQTITALALGLEASIRLALPAFNRFHLHGFHTTSIATAFGSALAAAKLEGASIDKCTDSLGIAGSFTSGLLECVPAGAGAKRLHAGWAAMSGVMAAQFALSGFTGPASILEGRFGLYNSFLPGETLDLDMVLADLGRTWHLLDIRPKLYPCCGYLQAVLDSACQLRMLGVSPDQISSIKCWIPSGARNIVGEPWDKRLHPTTAYETRFSLPFVVAVMLEQGTVSMTDFQESRANEPRIRRLMDLISYDVDPDFITSNLPGRVQVTLTDGTVHTEEILDVRGDAKAPFSEQELRTKFDANTSLLADEQSRRVYEAIMALDAASSISALLDPLRDLSAHSPIA